MAAAEDAAPAVDAQGAAAPAPAPGANQATGDGPSTEIVVSGVRASLERSMDLKRNSSGVVDGISAEDIGKFPDTNVAESLQRVAGVSIDRVNGEGQRVTVRGFGPGYNLVTLNGRTLPTASIASVGQDQNGDFVSGTTRSFDFSNIASEGVNRLEVYKTSRASEPGGGIGATINIVTRKPLDGHGGFTGSIGAKAVYDGSDTYDFSRVTPELSGLVNWANDEGTFGVNLFASYQKRNNSAASVTVNDWNIETFGAFRTNPSHTTPNAVFDNAPSDDELIAFPNDTRYDYSEFSRERINGQLTLQFKPTDTLEVTGDVTFYQNDSTEHRTDQTNWYNRPFSHVGFDGNSKVATTIFLDDTLSSPKDDGFEDQNRATREKMWSYGLNVGWDATDSLHLSLDGHMSKAQALPNNPLGQTSTLFSLAQKGVADQTLTYVNGFPQQSITFDDSVNGNNNGILDLPDLGSQVVRSQTASQSQKVNELRFDGAWDLGDDDRVNFGGSYRDSKMDSHTISTQNALGDWGVGHIGDIQANAANLIQEFCLVCKFHDYNPGVDGVLKTAFRGDATKLWKAFDFTPAVSGSPTHNQIDEKIWAAYAEVDAHFTLAGRPANIVAGVRYEHTDSHSVSFQTVPQAIVWTQNNDYTTIPSADVVPVEGKNSYDHILPGLDFSVDITDTLKGRVSYGKSISRPDFGSLFAATSPGAPNRPTFLGGVPGGNAGNPQLVPLVSDNFDASLEWYFAPASYVSVGFYDKRVKNFVGTGQTTTTLFGLQDPSSGAPGTTSGAAVNYLNTHTLDVSEDNFFVMTALIKEHNGDVAAAGTEFQSHLVLKDGQMVLDQGFIDQVGAAVDLTGSGNDPLYQFQIQQPVNNNEAHIHGFELQGQYFLGNTGFGVAAAYTLVRGDIGYDILAAPTSDQFALLGLSDTFNASLIFEKYGISARVTYNWRDKFLSNNSRGSSRNPVFVAPYDQWDANLSYDITPNIEVAFEAINITGSNTKTYARTSNEPWFIVDGRPRYYAGVRYKF